MSINCVEVMKSPRDAYILSLRSHIISLIHLHYDVSSILLFSPLIYPTLLSFLSISPYSYWRLYLQLINKTLVSLLLFLHSPHSLFYISLFPPSFTIALYVSPLWRPSLRVMDPTLSARTND